MNVTTTYRRGAGAALAGGSETALPGAPGEGLTVRPASPARPSGGRRPAASGRRRARTQAAGRRRDAAAPRLAARAEQRLVGVDVAHAGDAPLVEEERLERRAAALEGPAQVGNAEGVAERLRAHAGEELVLGRLWAFDPAAEAPHVLKRQVRLLIEPPDEARRPVRRSGT